MIVSIEGEVHPDRFRALWRQHFSESHYDLKKAEPGAERVPRRREDSLARPASVMRAHGRAGDTGLYWPADGHWAPRGHAVAGAALVDFLAREGLMDRGRMERGMEKG